MEPRATSDRFGRQPAGQLWNTIVAVLGIVGLSYFTVTSIEHTFSSHHASATFVGTPATEVETTAPRALGDNATGPCADLLDMTCAPRNYSSTGAVEEQPPTF